MPDYPQPTNDILSEEESNLWMEPASTGLRFANYIIDLVSFYILAFGLFYFIALFSPEFVDFVVSIPSLLDRLITLVLFGLYVSIFEGITKGRTLGKFVTRTRAIRVDGHAFGWGDAFGRGACRMIPFEPFSGFGTPWHDTWTSTKVVKVKN